MLLTPTAADPLAQVRTTLRAMAALAGNPPLNGLAHGLTVDNPARWRQAADLITGDSLPDLLDTARRRWGAAPHAAAALAWKCYSYWLALPVVLGYAAARRVPLVRPEGVVLRWSQRAPFVVVGLTRVDVAVLDTDPLALMPPPGVRVVPDEAALLAEARAALMDDHLAPLLERIRDHVRLGRRTLWGSLASGIAHGLSRAADVVPGPIAATANEVLTAFGLDDLVDMAPLTTGPGLAVQRRTCCLAFTLPEPKICTGCCILPAEDMADPPIVAGPTGTAAGR